MKRLAIAAVGLAAAAALAFGAGAFALYVWPGPDQGHDSHLEAFQAVHLVLTAPTRQDPSKRLGDVLSCTTPIDRSGEKLPKGAFAGGNNLWWQTTYEQSGIWYVVALCADWPGNLAAWMVNDATWQVVPDLGAESLGP